jgi:hypothetical protein
MPKLLFKAVVLLLTLAFAAPVIATSALAVEKTDTKVKKAKKKSSCGKEECMKAAPVK